MNGPIVHTWADGWGNWHATVVREDNDGAARACARRAILAQLGTNTRGDVPFIRLKCVARRVDSDGIGWYEYQER
jgi:hypothetical protein